MIDIFSLSTHKRDEEERDLWDKLLRAFLAYPTFLSGGLMFGMFTEANSASFIWVFNQNAAVLNPFGVFTATVPIKNTGILPRLLLLAPKILLWWLVLLYLSLPLQLKQVSIACGIFFACIVSLTYLSRSIDLYLAWSTISVILLFLVWGMGSNR